MRKTNTIMNKQNIDRLFVQFIKKGGMMREIHIQNFN